MNLGEVYLDVDIALDVDEGENGIGNEIEDKKERKEEEEEERYVYQ